FRRPSATVVTRTVGRLSPMAFLVGVTRGGCGPSPPPDASSGLDGGRALCTRRDRRLSRGRIALPPPGGGASDMHDGIRPHPICQARADPADALRATPAVSMKTGWIR